MRELQSTTIERHRKDTLQLLRIQNNLNTIGLALRDMLSREHGEYPLSSWHAEFDRLRRDLADALKLETQLTSRDATQTEYLTNSITQFWLSVDQVFSIAGSGDDERALRIVQNSLAAQQASLSNTVARLLVQNNESEQETANAAQRIYNDVERNIYILLLVLIVGLLVVSSSVIYFNRQIFNRLAELSEQKSTLARQLIGVQEEVLRSISRELHDEFGQILTAVGTMLSRAEKKGLPPDSPLRVELNEVRQVVHETLEKVRSLSQALHPTILDDYGLERAIERFVPQFEKQTGIQIDYEKTGQGEIAEGSEIHIYRILQEALNNVAKHSRAHSAKVRMEYTPQLLRLAVADDGVGLPAGANEQRRGLGLVAMAERAELLGGKLTLERQPRGGTLVLLEVPLGEL